MGAVKYLIRIFSGAFLFFVLCVVLLGFDRAEASYISNWDVDVDFPGGLEKTSYTAAGCLSDGNLVTGLGFYRKTIFRPVYVEVRPEVLSLFQDTNLVSVSAIVGSLSDASSQNINYSFTLTLIIPYQGRYQWSGTLSTSSNPMRETISFQKTDGWYDIDYESYSDDSIGIIISPNSGVFISELDLTYQLPPPPMPDLNGWIYDLEVSGAGFVDCRNYVQALFDMFIENDYYQAVYWPYYTISRWSLGEGSYQYWTVVLTQEPLIYTVVQDIDADSDKYPYWVDTYPMPHSYCMYSGLVNGNDWSTTLYLNGFYAPGVDPTYLYKHHLSEWIGLPDELSADLVYGCPVQQRNPLTFESELYSYQIITNYSITVLDPSDPTSGRVYTSAAVPQGWLDLYKKWNLAGGDPNGDYIKDILAKVTHIDNDLHDLLGNESEYSDSATAAIDSFLSSSKGSFDSAMDGIGGVITAAGEHSSAVKSSVSSITGALGDEWLLLVGLMAFGLIAILLQRRTG